MNIQSILLAPVAAVALTACVPQKPVLTPLALQSIQSRDFEEDYNIVFSSTVSVFQDLGYSITSADKNTGLISAESATDSNALAQIFGTTLNNQTRATAFIEKIKMNTKVRLNFVEIRKTSSRNGQSDRKDKPIISTEVYQNAFERISSAIFVRK